MTIDATDAWVLHVRHFGETSAYVTFFTREKGLVTCLYKGARRKKTQLQAFMPVWLSLSTTRFDTFFLKQVEVTGPSFSFIRDNLFAGLYVNELLYHALNEQEVHLSLYDLYVHTIRVLSETQDKMVIEIILRRFEWALLCTSGYSVSFVEDVLGAPIQAQHYYQYVADEGFKKAEIGIPGAHIIALSVDRIEDIAVLKTAKKIMRLAVDHLLGGKPIKARELYLCTRQK